MKLKNTLYLISCLLTAIVMGTLLMLAVYNLPVNAIRANVRKSISIYETENDGYYWAPWISSSHLDNYTDSLMINEAAFLGTGSVKNDAMNNPWVNYEDLSKSQCLVRSVSQDTLEGGTVVNYARYWHGYLIWLKPLLSFMTMADIRILSMCFQFTILTCLIIELYKKGGKKLVIPFGLVILSLNPISTALCMQYACVYSITLIAALIIIRRQMYDSNNYWHVFLWIGISTAYFDFLTYPIVGLGINLLLMLFLNKDLFWEKIKMIFVSSFSWIIGYGGMWSGKWVVSYILTGNNTLLEGISSVKYRAVGDDTVGVDTNSALKVIESNVEQFWNTPVKCILMICIIVIIGAIITKKISIKIDFKRVLPLFIVAFYPFVWYWVIRNHSAIHYWMTHRNLSITIFAVGLIIGSSVWKHNREGEQQNG